MFGYGHVCDATHSPITEAEAEVYLARDLMTGLYATLRYCPMLAAEPEGAARGHRRFTFNLGAGRLQTSTLRRRINQKDWAAAAQELRRWVYGGGRCCPASSRGVRQTHSATSQLLSAQHQKHLPRAATP